MNKLKISFFVWSACAFTPDFYTQAQTPGFEWAKKLGGTSTQGYAIATDASGNVYTAGKFNGTVDFDPGAAVYNLISVAFGDAYISKVDPSGNFVWAKNIGSAGADDAWGIAVDATGNVYTSGHFQNTADFDPGPGVFNLTATSGDIFVSKLDTDGNFVWAKRMGGPGLADEYGYDITVDASGNVYTTGTFVGTADFDPGTGVFNLTAAASSDVFISKLDTDGIFVWAKRLGGTQAEEGKSITLDGSGNIYTTGFFRGTCDFDPGATAFDITSTSIFNDIFVSKLDPAGNFIWAKNMGGTGDDTGLALAVDGSGNVYTTGYFFDTADFDPGAATFNLTAAGSSASIFISKLDASGNFSWAKRIGRSSPYPSFGRSITTDASGNVYTTGSFEGVVDFDPGAGEFNLQTAGDDDIFILKLDAAGNFLWAGSMGYVNSGDDSGQSITLDATGKIYTTGYVVSINFDGNTDFDPGGCVSNLNGVGAFVQKLSASSAASHTITNFSPSSGPVGTTVTITGTNFSTTPANNVVQFNGTVATVTSSSTTSITTTVPSGATTGPITVTIGCNAVTGGSNFTVATGATITFTTQPANSTVCSLGNTTFSVVASGDVNLQYQWQVDNSGFVNLTTDATYSGVNTATLTVTNPAVSLNGTVYRCLVRGDNTSDTPSGNAVLTVTSISPATITVNGTTLTASTGDDYQWYQNGEEISGATNQTFEYNVFEYGAYTVEVTENGCTSTSDEFVYFITGTEPLSQGWKIYPNPFTTQLFVESPSIDETKIEITDALGRTVKTFSINGSENISLDELSDGAYFLTLHTSRQILHFRITKKR